MTVAYAYLERQYAELRGDLDAAYSRVMASGHFIRGEELLAFEREFSRFLGVGHCVGVANGYDALAIALEALGVGSGQEVIVPDHTFIATWLAVTSIGAEVVPVDVLEGTYNIDPSAVSKAITDRTVAIIPVHLYGMAADMSQLMEIANRYGLKVLEDCAQAHGARWKGKPVGTFGHAAAFSFYPTKNLGCFGDGGAIVTNAKRIDEQVRALSNYGSSTKNLHTILGRNSRLDELQAAFLRVKLRALEGWVNRKQKIARFYFDSLNGKVMGLYGEDFPESHVWHIFPIRVRDRTKLANRLASRGISTQVHYPRPPHLQPAYSGLNLVEGSFPIAERISREELSLPIDPTLLESEQSEVVESIISLLEAG